MSQPDREQSLAALEASERGGDTKTAEQWRSYLASITPPRPPGKPRLPPPPTLFSAPSFCARICPKPHKKGYLELIDPSAGRLFAMLRWGQVTDVVATPGTLSFVGALHSSDRSGVVCLSLPGVDTAAAAAGLRRRLKLPKTPLPLEEAELRSNADHYDGLLVGVSGTWSHGFEHSSFADLWLSGPEVAGATGRNHVSLAVHVVGFVSMGRSGHLGGSRGSLTAVSITPIP